MIKRLLLRPKYWKIFKFPFKLKLLDSFFELLRPLFVKDIDINEDFYCGWCCKPVLRRHLFCSSICSIDFDKPYIRMPREGKDHFAVVKNNKERKCRK